MQSLFTYISPPGQCGYLPDQQWQLRYEVAGQMERGDYAARLQAGWRRFGFSLFRPECPTCRRCMSLRVDVARFRPNDSQKRARKANARDIQLVVGPPGVTPEKLALYDKFHASQTERKGWPEHGPESATSYIETFVNNPFVTEEWCYYLGPHLVGVGYVDNLRVGLSAIYFYHDPAERNRSLGTFNVLSVIAAAAARGLPHVYLGFFVAGCSSLEYKAKFRPNETLQPNGEWRPFVE
ncbi:arginyltransferase [Fimbriiglobus ruber]|uniref:Arginine-tRNA-protein transferase n=1 Tax=Fimbriiglobus ruber TaxID=1908690 RepID=A0A225DPJ1_9BACT|nr:arginyltransferase [Fimbriiglobus ruber]OWK40508.1 Arginine-tRNA-protein transferase [Fimbriiglobus ruber]